MRIKTLRTSLLIILSKKRIYNNYYNSIEINLSKVKRIKIVFKNKKILLITNIKICVIT
jgi:hypothetical protein